MIFSRGTFTITWSPRTTDHFKKLNAATHVHRLVRDFEHDDGPIHHRTLPV
ncbi:hypothetical protein RISK_004348 [Rhodopirellula islandica]|uniref:Uncharacterized protein n=1 Tax=Rhodopirellula islandica TaxID=595434 RepID=A0A0J1BAT5_RHOIS|nr:hypothetical protein RISK_004348 [Rhodopirellula islandica]